MEPILVKLHLSVNKILEKEVGVPECPLLTRCRLSPRGGKAGGPEGKQTLNVCEGIGRRVKEKGARVTGHIRGPSNDYAPIGNGRG
jgi:hypothetical protein